MFGMDLTTAAGRQELGKRIQAAVSEAGYPSLPEFAKSLHCSRALIYQYAKGDVLVQLDKLQQIARLCDKPVTWFLAEERNGIDSLRTDMRSEKTLDFLLEHAKVKGKA